MEKMSGGCGSEVAGAGVGVSVASDDDDYVRGIRTIVPHGLESVGEELIDVNDKTSCVTMLLYMSSACSSLCATTAASSASTPTRPTRPAILCSSASPANTVRTAARLRLTSLVAQYSFSASGKV